MQSVAFSVDELLLIDGVVIVLPREAGLGGVGALSRRLVAAS